MLHWRRISRWIFFIFVTVHGITVSILHVLFCIVFKYNYIPFRNWHYLISTMWFFLLLSTQIWYFMYLYVCMYLFIKCCTWPKLIYSNNWFCNTLQLLIHFNSKKGWLESFIFNVFWDIHVHQVQQNMLEVGQQTISQNNIFLKEFDILYEGKIYQITKHVMIKL